MVQAVTPAHKGLAASRLIPIFIRKDAYAGHTHCIYFKAPQSQHTLQAAKHILIIEHKLKNEKL
jgi:hypothetical protein